MDPYFRQRHGSGPSPIDDSSPHSANSQYRNFGAGAGAGSNIGTNNNNGNGLDRILQSPQDLSNFNRFSAGMDAYSTLVNDGSRGNGNGVGFDAFQYAQPQASTSGTSNQPLAPPSQTGIPTGKRGTKACVACE